MARTNTGETKKEGQKKEKFEQPAGTIKKGKTIPSYGRKLSHPQSF
jgi:hypothetical protein